jgi:hypothetical protein
MNDDADCGGDGCGRVAAFIACTVLVMGLQHRGCDDDEPRSHNTQRNAVIIATHNRDH